ncbi:MAG: M23 family metallopeptidase [Clostridia bacterium]|nr:M23 family metallopeptidase [Clostridia bacterium]
MAITSIFKNIVIYLRTWIKLLLMFLIGFAIIGFIVFVVYKPMYRVTLNGEILGYTEDKSKLSKKINDYLDHGDSKSVAFVEIDSKPEYNLCMLKKGLTANDEEIYTAVISAGVPYYKYYAILENGVEKYYVSTYEEADAIIEELKTKNSQNKDSVTYVLKYETELKDFVNSSTAVATLYKEMPKAKKPKVNTNKNVSYDNSALGIALVEPVAGTITSRFGRRSGGTHTGLDIANSTGTPIKAAAAGTVVYSGYKGSYGRLVIVAHTNSIQTYYAHCSRLYVNAGQTVSQGEVIAAVGSTGNSTGPHLHLEVRVNGVAKNPQNYVYGR